MQIMGPEDISPYKDEADKIRKVLDAPPTDYPLGRETMYAQMLGSAEQALRDAEVTRQGFLADESTIGKLTAELAKHKECLPRDAVEDLLGSKLPCGHPNACGFADASGANIRCHWCDEVKALMRDGSWRLGVAWARVMIQDRSKELMQARPRKIEQAAMLDTLAAQLDRFESGDRPAKSPECREPTCEDGMIDSGGVGPDDHPIDLPCPVCNPCSRLARPTPPKEA